MSKSRLKKYVAAVAAGLSLSMAGMSLAQGQGDQNSSNQEDGSPQLIAEIARSFGLAAEHLAWANDIEPTAKVQKGQELKVPERIRPGNPPHDGAVVNLAERGLYLYDNDRFQGFYPISIGQSSNPSYHTPTGKYEVLSRVKNPVWQAPDSDWAQAMEKDRIDADSPDNPLGEYWFGIGQGYGFHENVNPIYTGDDVSHGCMRLYPEHARQIYQGELLSKGDEVRIVNRPIITSGLETDTPSVAVFPSIYGVPNDKNAIRRQLEYNGIVLIVCSAKMEGLSQRASGIPVELLGPEVTVQTSEKVSTGRLLDDGTIVPTSLARELGLEVKYDGEQDSVTISRGERTRTYPIDGRDVHRWNETTYIGARQLLETFAVPFQWQADSKTLRVGEVSRD